MPLMDETTTLATMRMSPPIMQSGIAITKVLERTPRTIKMIPGNEATKPTSPKPPWAMMFSPHVLFSNVPERLSADQGPSFSNTMIGMVKKVTTLHAAPIRLTTIWPTKPAFSSIAAITNETVP